MATPRTGPRTMFAKIWDRHVIARRGENSLLYVDRHLVHEGSFHAFRNLASRGLKVRRPAQTFGTADHYAPTVGRKLEDAPGAEIRHMLTTFHNNVTANELTAFELDDPRQGIVHVVGPELGLTLPGFVLVCGDSHTSTHGALGCLAFGIGQSENEHVLATQTIWQTTPKVMRISIEDRLPRGVTAKDVILGIIARIGTGGATGYVIEYAGAAVRGMTVEERLTVCNMSIEAGARAGMVAPDDTTYSYLCDKPYAPAGAAWDRAVGNWRLLASDPGASYDRELTLDAEMLAPMVTWGTSPQDALPIDGHIPDPDDARDPTDKMRLRHVLRVMGLAPGIPLEGLPVDRVFIGSCTNGRIEDLRAAAAIVRGRRAHVASLVVPGSETVRHQAESEGLHRVFQEAGFEWRHAGCSMCVGTNGDLGTPGDRIASTSNRNFEGRQGRGVRTHLMSPAMAAAAAVTGRLTDVRKLGAW
ncbi:3-isopropylmalate dehydratase large subunit [Candidimonas nitroreducens]|uniref:3-isopropylmalate dehydratase n=2 Tax=Candidimonas nitroreducens TaxID=683354 RepID=A0A225MLM6_9BURK|nr:3-isopropylmalate dehydratase large subunit [Candidimonas nitroreducens]